MLERLRDAIHRPIGEEEDKFGRIRQMNLILSILPIAVSLYTIISSIAAQRVDILMVLAAAVTLILALLFARLARRGLLNLAVIFLVILLSLAVNINALYSGNGIRSASYSLNIVLIYIDGLLLGTAGAMMGAVVALLAGCVMLLTHTTWPMPVVSTITTFSTQVVAFIFSAVLFQITESERQRALSRARENECELAAANQELLASRDSLESQVAERTQKAEQALLEAEKSRRAIETQAWQSAALADINQAMTGEQNLPTLARNVIRQLCRAFNASVGALFILENDVLALIGSYGYPMRKNISSRFRLGEGLVGQAALEQQTLILTHVPDNYLPVQTSLLEANPRQIIAAPFLDNGELIGVVEMAILNEFTATQKELLAVALENIGNALVTTQTRRKVDELLAETQRQARELQAQQHELRITNEELQQHTLALSASQQNLQAQQTALESANEELEEKARVLQEQRSLLDRQNQELKAAQRELEQKAEELTLNSRYKSEFLANMSHELRTPLNSLLILAQMLAGNEEGNLTAEQVESARIIYHSGSDLLTLINEILDLAKVESGRMQFYFEPVLISNIVQALYQQFKPVADERGLFFEIVLADGLPATLVSDQQRLLQVLRNLLSNAFKFTTQGSVRMLIERPGPAARLHDISIRPEQAIAFRISDTGIGMTPEQQKIVFDPFQQADGSTSRKYGGTGLGLTISQQMVIRLGGKIELISEFHKGSTFTVYLPEGLAEPYVATPEISRPTLQALPKTTAAPWAPASQEEPSVQEVAPPAGAEAAREVVPPPVAEAAREVPGTLRPVTPSEAEKPAPAYSKAGAADGGQPVSAAGGVPAPTGVPAPAGSSAPAGASAGSGALGPADSSTWSGLPNPGKDDRALLKKDDHILLVIEDDLEFARVIYDYAHRKGFKCLIAADGESSFQLVQAFHPSAIVLDLNLPGMSGWQVLQALKNDPNLRPIPVHILSADSENLDAYKMGAIGFLTKPVTARQLDEVFVKIETLIAGGIKNLLVVEDDSALRHSVRQLLSGSDVRISETDQGQAAIDMMRARKFDCMILDLTLPDMTGFELLSQVHQDLTVHKCPVIVYTGKELTEEENTELMKYAESIIIKGAKSPERLLEETALFLHRIVSQNHEEPRPEKQADYDRDAVFSGKHILMVDDDMRNAFALSRLLGGKGFKISIASSGQKALEILDADPGIDLVLMDIMMPIMDGYETMRRIRAQDRFHNLPILALTAKAMAGDKEKCIEAGADDYLSKPVDAERLLSVLRVWLCE